SLATKIFANVPGWGETVFNVICRWLSEDTKRKFVVVSKASAPRVLAERIGEANLPEKFRPSNVVEEEKSDVVASTAEPESSTTEPPLPQTAHVDQNESVPRPTSRGSHQSNSGSSVNDSQDADMLPPPPVVTAAPELEPQPEALVSETAGMRLDDTATADAQEFEDKRGAQV
ncbi:hypothetical protein GGI08_007413, partial [Coemansia sp. S2]